MYSLIYMSVANKAMQQEEIDEILGQSRYNNSHDGITGCLAYIEGQSNQEEFHRFIQILEGTEHKIADLFERIQRDRRHSQVTLVVHGPIQSRNFESWQMHFERIDLDQSPSLKEFFEIDPLVLSRDQDINNHLLLHFLKSFCEND